MFKRKSEHFCVCFFFFNAAECVQTSRWFHRLVFYRQLNHIGFLSEAIDFNHLVSSRHGNVNTFLELGLFPPLYPSKHFCGCRRADSCNHKTPFHKYFYTHTYTHRECRNDTHGCARFAAFFFQGIRSYPQNRFDSRRSSMGFLFLLAFAVVCTKKEEKKKKNWRGTWIN